MKRREFITLIGAAAAGWSVAAQAQQTTTRTIGWLSLRSADTSSEKSILAAFRQGLGQTGYVEGRNLTIEYRFGDGQYDRLPALAADLVRRQVEVLVTDRRDEHRPSGAGRDHNNPDHFCDRQRSSPGGHRQEHQPAGRQQHRSVCAQYCPGAQASGVAAPTLSQRSLGRLPGEPEQLEHPRPDTASSIRSPQHGVELLVLNATTASEIDAAFASLVQHGVDGLVMGNDPFFQVQQDQLIALAARHRLPTIYEWPEFVRAGGLACYSTDRVEMCRQMGVYVSRILNGAKPAELPVMQPTKFELVINLKTARSLGLKMAESFPQLADEVIE